MSEDWWVSQCLQSIWTFTLDSHLAVMVIDSCIWWLVSESSRRLPHKIHCKQHLNNQSVTCIDVYHVVSSSSRLLSLYSFLLQSFLCTFFWLVGIAVCGSLSAQGTSLKYLEPLWTDVELQFPMRSQLQGCPYFLCYFFYSFFLKWVVTCRWCVISVREDNDFNA